MNKKLFRNCSVCQSKMYYKHTGCKFIRYNERENKMYEVTLDIMGNCIYR